MKKEIRSFYLTKQEYIDAIMGYNKYAASVAKVFATLYKTSVDLKTTLTTSEVTERTGLNYAVSQKNISFLKKGGFIDKIDTARQWKTYLISQEKLDMLVAIMEAKR